LFVSSQWLKGGARKGDRNAPVPILGERKSSCERERLDMLTDASAISKKEILLYGGVVFSPGKKNDEGRGLGLEESWSFKQKRSGGHKEKGP